MRHHLRPLWCMLRLASFQWLALPPHVSHDSIPPLDSALFHPKSSPFLQYRVVEWLPLLSSQIPTNSASSLLTSTNQAILSHFQIRSSSPISLISGKILNCSAFKRVKLIFTASMPSAIITHGLAGKRRVSGKMYSAGGASGAGGGDDKSPRSRLLSGHYLETDDHINLRKLRNSESFVRTTITVKRELHIAARQQPQAPQWQGLCSQRCQH